MDAGAKDREGVGVNKAEQSDEQRKEMHEIAQVW